MAFEKELTRIHNIRKAHPTYGPYTLARKIRRGEVNDQGTTVASRPFYSTYSVIRRYDAKQKATVPASKKSRKTVAA